LSREYAPEGLCTASKKYQDIKFRELDAEKDNIPEDIFKRKREDIAEKACLCVGLVNAAYLEQNIHTKGEQQGVVICPGPNLAFFDKEVSLSKMVQHIYGNTNILSDLNRPNMFINELKMYVDHLKKELADYSEIRTHAKVKKWNTYKDNLLQGIDYYKNLFAGSDFFKKDLFLTQQLQQYQYILQQTEIPQA
jgi:hypothetical protein